MGSVDARGVPGLAVGWLGSNEGTRGEAGCGCSSRREDPAQVMNGITLREFAPRQSLGGGVGEGILLLVVPRLATPRRIDDDRRSAESHLLRLSRIVIPPDAKSDGTEKVKSRSGM